MPDAVETVWPKTVVQTCVVHLLRNSFKYATRRDYDKIARALKPVYTAPTEDGATERFMEFADAWGKKHPAIVKLWSDAWSEVVPFLAFDVEIRKSSAPPTQSRASTPASVRPSGPAGTSRTRPPCAQVCLPCVDEPRPDRRRWTMRWKAPLNAFQIAFEGRLDPTVN